MYIETVRLDRVTMRGLPLVEAATVSALFLLALFLARPQLEGWGVQSVFQNLGFVEGYISFLHGAPTRIFEPLPLGAAWIVSHGIPWGVGLVYGILIIGKYLAGRWVGGSAMPPLLRWLCGVAAAVMFPWMEAWRGHNMAQQLAALAIVLSFGAAQRAARQPGRFFPMLLCTGVLLSLLTYEGVIFCVLVIPLFVKIRDFHENLWSTPSLRRTVPPVLIALLVYIAIFLTVQSVMPSTYHSALLKAESPLRHPARLLLDLYGTAYLHGSWTSTSVILLVGVLCYFIHRTPEVMWTSIASSWIIGCTAIVLPLLGLSFAVNFYFLLDVERIGLPVGLGMFMLVESSLVNVRDFDVRRSDLVIISVAVLALLTGEALNAYESYLPFKLQDRLLRQLSQTMQADTAKRPVLLRDWTGTLGDLYTFYSSAILQQVLAFRGNRNDVELCTADGVDRHWAKFWDVKAGGGLQRCGIVDPPSVDRLVVDFKTDPVDIDAPARLSAFGIERAPDSGKIVAKILEGSFSGREGRLIWINQPHAIISVENKTPDQHAVTWRGSFTPPPCPAQVSLHLTFDDTVTAVQVPAPVVPISLTTALAAGQIKRIVIDMDTSGCRLEGDNRSFYVGIVDMTTLIQ